MKVAMILDLLLCNNDHDFQGCSCFFPHHAPNCDGFEKSIILRVLTSMLRAS